ncbi:hypothetical protein ACL02S_19440 [Nocardia sp. 004]|uniref:hypothetical protein n=1 Tax=Nocardia sp. 004 TaxID=3385978 RepID=UPI0039A116F5
MSHSLTAAASETSGAASVLRPGLVFGVVAVDSVVVGAGELVVLPLGAGAGDSGPHAVETTAVRTLATSRVVREIQRLLGIGTSGCVGIVGIESAIDRPCRPVMSASVGIVPAEPPGWLDRQLPDYGARQAVVCQGECYQRAGLISTPGAFSALAFG